MSTAASEDEVVGDGDLEVKCVLSAIDILHDTKKFSDITFLVGPNGDEVKAHKIILMSRSQVFEELNENWNKSASGENQIQIMDTNPHTFAEFIQYLYKSEIEFKDPHGLAYLGNKYGVFDLIKSVAQKLLKNPHPRNFALNFKLSTSIPDGLEGVRQEALDHFLTHMDLICQSESFFEMEMDLLFEIVKSENLCSINEHTLFENLIKWGSEKLREGGKVVDGSNLRSLLDPIIYFVRLPHMLGSHLATVVAQHGVLTHEEMLSIFYYQSTKNKDLIKFKTDWREGQGSEKRSCGGEIEYDDVGLVVEGGGNCQCSFYN